MKKRVLAAIFTAFAATSLASCNNNITDVNQVTPTENNETKDDDQKEKKPNTNDTKDVHENDDKKDDNNQGKNDDNQDVKKIDFNFETPEITGDADPSRVIFEKKHFDNSLKKDGPLTDCYCPSTGSPRILVVPVNLDESHKDNEILDKCKKAFVGTSEETGWESVNSYYKKSSFGKLDLQYEFTDWYTPKNDKSYYSSYEDGDVDGSALLLSEILTYFDESYDYNDFDSDKDGYIDNVVMLYNCDISEDGSGLYWAFQTLSPIETKFDGIEAASYLFAGTDFVNTKWAHEQYDTSSIKIDAHTYIHESGHSMGLDDYYDYSDRNTGRSLFGADMMDYNIGDHNAMNKMLLGWVDPTIVTGSGDAKYELSSYTETGDFLVFANHKLKSIYDEMIIVELYTNTGLNQNDTPILDKEDKTAIGLRIIHVDAHKNINSKGEVVMSDGENYQTGFKYNNSEGSTPFIEQLYNGSISNNGIDADSLFSEGDVFGTDKYASFKLNDGSALWFTISVEKIENGKCTISVSMK